MALNGIPVQNYPKLEYGDIETPDLNELAGALNSLVGAGVLTPDDALEDYVREYGNLPAVDNETARYGEAPEIPQEEIKAIYGEGEKDDE